MMHQFQGRIRVEPLEVLLAKRWILKSEDKTLYYQILDQLGELKKFTTEKMGCQLISNSLLVKLEKIPPVPEISMGIEEFKSQEEYAFLCMVLMFLEDKEAEEQFILSQLTEYIASNMPGETVDWTLYTKRRQLIKVLRFCMEQGMIKVTDGSDSAFADSYEGEVLYENTGASRYFMKTFSRDVMSYREPEDFQESDWFEVDEDRGAARRQRIYKRLLFSVGMYRGKDSDEDFGYLKNYGRRLADELEQMFDCRLDIHRDSAFFLSGDSDRSSMVFPGNSAMGDILLLCCHCIRERIREGLWTPDQRGIIYVDRIAFEQLLRELKGNYAKGFIKTYRELPEQEFVRQVMAELRRWTLIDYEEKNSMVQIYPSAGKLEGYYPTDFSSREEPRTAHESSSSDAAEGASVKRKKKAAGGRA